LRIAHRIASRIASYIAHHITHHIAHRIAHHCHPDGIWRWHCRTSHVSLLTSSKKILSLRHQKKRLNDPQNIAP
jgi:hypothetical protein